MDTHYHCWFLAQVAGWTVYARSDLIKFATARSAYRWAHRESPDEGGFMVKICDCTPCERDRWPANPERMRQGGPRVLGTAS